jgi:hypothetical protein
VAEVDPLLALQPVETMKDVMSESEAPRRFNTDLITAFAIAALGLALTENLCRSCVLGVAAVARDLDPDGTRLAA